MFAELNTRKVEVLKPFFNNPELETSIRGLSRLSDTSTSWTSEIITELEEKNFLKTESTKTSKKITTGKKFKQLKKTYNLDTIESSGLAKHLEEELRPDAIVLFGSYSRGEDNKDSDIDIAVINGRNKDLDLEKFEEELGRKINIQNLESADEGDENFRNSLANGTVLRGFLKVV